MRNRNPANPGRIKLTPIDAANGIYDLTRADGATGENEGTPLNKRLLDFAVAACGTTAGTSAELTLDDEFGGFTLTDGAKINFKLHIASAAGVTINVNGTGAKPILSYFGSRVTLPAGAWITAVYSADKDAFLTDMDANTATRIAIFTESTEITIPENIYGDAHVLMFGGGGGVWSSSSSSGGGGGYMEEFDINLTAGETYEIVIGAGGNLSDGGATTFAGHSAAGGKRPTAWQNGGHGGSGGGASPTTSTVATGGDGQYGGGGGSGTYVTTNTGNGGNGGKYGGGGGGATGGRAGTGGEFGGNGGTGAIGANGTDVDGVTVAFSPYFLLLCDYFNRPIIGTAKATGGVRPRTPSGGGGGGYGGKGGDSSDTIAGTSLTNGSGGGGGYGCKGGNGASGQRSGGGGGGGYGDDGADGATYWGGGGGGFFGIAARGGGGSRDGADAGKDGQSGCVCIIYRTVEV